MINAPTTTLVVAASGTVGSALAQSLAEQGHSVRRATSKTAPAAGQVHLNLSDPATIAPAFAGVDKAFLLSPPGYVNQDQLLIPLIDQARKQGLSKVVLMTAMGANADASSPMRKAEVHLEQSGLSYNIIRPNWFMQNFNTFWLHGILAQGKIFLPVGSAKGSFIDARDIAAVAAALLSRDDVNNRDFDLTGSQAFSHDEVAKILSQESGRNIAFEDLSPEAMLQGLLAAGLPRPYAEFMLLILGYFKAGYAERTTDSVQNITGNAPRSFAQYAKDYRAAWLG